MDVLPLPLTRLKLRHLADGLGGQSEVARLLQVDRSRVSRWLSGEEPIRRTRPGSTGSNTSSQGCCSAFPPDRPQVAGRHQRPPWQRRPLDLIGSNRIAEVIAAIEQADLDSTPER
jgi:DNA-binding transcriptional regulator YdaS (Cro superfamily)